MTEYINNRQTKFCKDEHRISPHLFSCLSKEPCEYKRTYPHFHICKKRESYGQSEDLFKRNKEDIERNGEEYHQEHDTN